MSRTYKFPESYKGKGTIVKYIDFTSGALLLASFFIWMFLYSTIGRIIPMAAHAIGIILSLGSYILYTVRIPSEYYNKLGGERLYKLFYLGFMHHRKNRIYVKKYQLNREGDKDE